MKPTYSNDRKAPRMKKGQFSKMVITKDLHKRFCEEYPEHKVTWVEFCLHWKNIAEKIRHYAIYNPLGVKLGSYTGELKLQYLPYKFKAKDHNTSNELGEKVDFLNIPIKGKVGTIKWERRWAVKFNKMLQFFAFDEARILNRMAKKHIDANPEALRISRNTLGGHSVWRTKRRIHEHKTSNG